MSWTRMWVDCDQRVRHEKSTSALRTEKLVGQLAHSYDSILVDFDFSYDIGIRKWSNQGGSYDVVLCIWLCGTVSLYVFCWLSV